MSMETAESGGNPAAAPLFCWPAQLKCSGLRFRVLPISAPAVSVSASMVFFLVYIVTMVLFRDGHINLNRARATEHEAALEIQQRLVPQSMTVLTITAAKSARLEESAIFRSGFIRHTRRDQPQWVESVSSISDVYSRGEPFSRGLSSLPLGSTRP